MSIIGTILIGFVVGFVAKLLTPGRDPQGFLITIVIGIAGSLFATWAGHMLGWYRPDEAAGFIGSVIGAIILLVVFGAIRRRNRAWF